jgi:hypothetical protein
VSSSPDACRRACFAQWNCLVYTFEYFTATCSLYAGKCVTHESLGSPVRQLTRCACRYSTTTPTVGTASGVCDRGSTVVVSGVPVVSGTVSLGGDQCAVATFAQPLNVSDLSTYTVVVSAVQAGIPTSNEIAVAPYTSGFTSTGVTVCIKPFELLYDADVELPEISVSYVVVPIASNVDGRIATGSVARAAEVFAAETPSCFTVSVPGTPRAVFTSPHFFAANGEVRRSARPSPRLTAFRGVDHCARSHHVPDMELRLRRRILPRVRGHHGHGHRPAGRAVLHQLHRLL